MKLVKGNQLSEVRLSVHQEPETVTSHQLSHIWRQKQAKCLAKSKKTVQGETRVCSRQRPPAKRQEPGQQRQGNAPFGA